MAGTGKRLILGEAAMRTRVVLGRTEVGCDRVVVTAKVYTATKVGARRPCVARAVARSESPSP
jgi:hypothetical protein